MNFVVVTVVVVLNDVVVVNITPSALWVVIFRTLKRKSKVLCKQIFFVAAVFVIMCAKSV